ncbi:hypothetical protein [Thalassobellus citreus]|uniref:hypothetical protein n=1 Tax=Thalassobellus citreus TaxID=3367752 RepID=UPI0037B820AA
MEKVILNTSIQNLDNPENYVPMAGDIVVIQSYAGGSVHGHIQIYNGTQWVSDFKQSDFWPGSGYSKNEPSYNIFR